VAKVGSSHRRAHHPSPKNGAKKIGNMAMKSNKANGHLNRDLGLRRRIALRCLWMPS
jgi:hypothetical protein